MNKLNKVEICKIIKELKIRVYCTMRGTSLIKMTLIVNRNVDR